MKQEQHFGDQILDLTVSVPLIQTMQSDLASKYAVPLNTTLFKGNRSWFRFFEPFLLSVIMLVLSSPLWILAWKLFLPDRSLSLFIKEICSKCLDSVLSLLSSSKSSIESLIESTGLTLKQAVVSLVGGIVISFCIDKDIRASNAYILNKWHCVCCRKK